MVSIIKAVAENQLLYIVHLFKNIIEHQFVLAIMLNSAMVRKATVVSLLPFFQSFTYICYNTKSSAGHPFHNYSLTHISYHLSL